MGRKLPPGEESRNIRELTLFRQYWRESPEYPEENFGNDRVRMPVQVIYEWGNGHSTVTFLSDLVAFVGSGPNDGDVDVADTEKVRIEEFHLSFKAAFQRYHYDEAENALIISDSSPKMGGRYSVQIRPTLEAPT